jgi:hypothetical protein
MPDRFGNYVPGMQGPVAQEIPTGTPPPPVISIQGSPEGIVPGVFGWQAQDSITGNIYLKMTNQGATGWLKVGTLGGGSTGTSFQAFAGDYGGDTPTPTPTTSIAFAIDVSNGRQWQWFSGLWH